MARPTIVRGTDTRDAVLTAAWRLARRDGIASLTVRDLAAEVGMQAPSLYHHFEGKAAIYDAMFRHGHAAVNRMVAGLDLPPNPRTAMVTACQAWLAFCQQDWTRYQLLYTRVIPGWEPSPDAYAVSVEGFELMRGQLAALGMDDAGADLYVAIAAGLAAQQFANEPDGQRWIGQASRAMTMLHDNLLAGAEPVAADEPRGGSP